MKTKKDIQLEISELSEPIMNGSLTESQEKKTRNKITELRELMAYFNFDPTEGLLIKMQEDCENKIRIYDKRLKEWIDSKPESELAKLKNPVTYYYKEIAPKDLIELKSTKKQLSNINHLLA